MNHEAGIKIKFSHRPAFTPIHQCLHGRLRLEVNVLHARRVEVAVHQHLIGGRVAVEAAEDDVARLADLLVTAGCLQRGRDGRQQKIGRREDEADVRVRLKRVRHPGLRLLLVPFARHARHDFDEALVPLHRRLEAVAPPDGIDVAEVAQHDHRLVLRAGLARLLNHVGHGFLRELRVVRDDGGELRVGFVGGPVEEHDGNLRLVRRANHRDARLRVLRHEDDAVHATRNEVLHLLELPARIAVGHGLEHRDVALLQLGLDGLEPRDPILRLQCLERDADGFHFAGRGGSRRR